MDLLDDTVDMTVPDKNIYTDKPVLKMVISAICALLNSNGGKVVCSSQISLAIRTLEQSMISIIGLNRTVSNIDFKEGEEYTIILVEKADFFVTSNYNLYLPTQTQVVQMSSVEPVENVKDDIMNRKVVLEPVQLGSHCQMFLKDKNCGFHENKMRQLKHLKADPSKRVTLADRMIGKGNKFSSYVSAFANHKGGHIYYGITDDKVVEGEFIPNEEDKNEITKKVGKAINKMIWPQQICQPERGVHWEIFFEAVVDKNSKPIPSTFVIVIYIAPCLGGVFTEEPECYEVVDGKVEKMSFSTWKKRILGTVEIDSIPRGIGSSITWISKRTRTLCIQEFCILTAYLNNGDWKGFRNRSTHIEKKYPEVVEMKLVVLLKRILARSRKHHFNTANQLLKTYDNLLPSATEYHIFEVLGLYVHAALTRPKGGLDHIRDLLVNALVKSEWLLPGIVTALVYLFAGTMTDHFDDTCLRPPDVLSHNALEHLQLFMPNNPEIRADLEYKAHITLATYHLGCNLSAHLDSGHIHSKRLIQADSSIKAVEESASKGNKLTRYREVQLSLVKSIRNFRYWEVQPDERSHSMQKAFQLSKNAENLARKRKFFEMVSWSKSLQGLYAEKLVRAKFPKQKMA